MAKHLGISQPTIVRIEAGEGALLPRAKVEVLLDFCQASEVTRDRVLTLTESAHSETWRWGDAIDDATTHLQGIAAASEADAALIRTYSMQWMPGLLQTAAYASALLPQVDPTGRMDHSSAVAARLERQQRLHEPGRRFAFLVEEAVLKWMPSAGVMPAQLDRLMSLMTLDNVEIGLLPSSRVGGSGWHSFALLELIDGSTQVTTELLHGGQVVTEEDQVDLYVALWEQLWAAALHGDDAIKRMRSA